MPENNENNKTDSEADIQAFYEAPSEQSEILSAQAPLKGFLIWISLGSIFAYFVTMSICILPFIEDPRASKIDTSSLFMAMTLNASLWILAIKYFMPRLTFPKMVQTSVSDTIKHIITGIIYMYAMLVVFNLINYLIQKVLGYTPELQDIAQRVAQSSTQDLALLILTTVILVPIVEELLFRGLLYRSLKTKTKPLYAAILSAALFALVHGEMRVMPQLFVLGLIFSYFYEKNGSLAVPITLHCSNNLIGVTMLIYS